MPENEFFESENKIEEGFSDCTEQSDPSYEEGFEEKTESAEVKHTYVTYVPYGLTPETFEERQAIKKASRTAGVAFLAVQAVILVLNLLLVFAITAVEKAFSLSQSLLSEPAILQAVQIFLSMLVFTLPFIVVYKIFGHRISDLISFKKPKKGTSLPFFLFGIGFCAFANIATSIAAGFFENFGVEYDIGDFAKPEGIFGFALSLIATVIVPAFVEEFACRGIILGSLRKFGDGFAIIVSAILFGLMHGNFQQIPFAFLVGLVLGFVTVQSGSVWIGIAIHAFNNAISVIFDYFLSGIAVDTQNAIYTVFLCISMILGLLGIALLKENDAYKLALSKTAVEEKQKYKWFFCGVFIIIFSIISVLESLAYFV